MAKLELTNMIMIQNAETGEVVVQNRIPEFILQGKMQGYR